MRSSAPARWQVLQNARQFGVVMQQGRVVARSPHFALHTVRWPHLVDSTASRLEESGAEDQAPHTTWRTTSIFPTASAAPAYYGAIVPKRWARRAVTRNLIKRQIRHVVGVFAPSSLDGLALVLRLRAAFDPQQFISASSALLRQAVRHELMQVLQQASQQDWQLLPRLPATPGQANTQARTAASTAKPITASARQITHTQSAQ